MADGDPKGEERVEAVAIVGMACRVPGASDPETFWRNLRAGVESVSSPPDEALLAAGIPRHVVSDPRYVRARALLEGVDRFDASFFGMTPGEAAITDPQHRLFLECAWEALERAGCNPQVFRGAVGVYAGAGGEGYRRFHLDPAGRGVDPLDDAPTVLANDRDHLTTHAAHKLDLRGPCVTVQTACSTSLVAVQMACHALLSYQCDLALAGGVSVAFPLGIGHLHQEGHLLSGDGHCRAFDAGAAGTVGGDGAGVVALKRLSDAVAGGDHIHAVILGAAVNNDGARRVGYAAPGVLGQAEVVALAHAMAGVDAGTIGYVEAHGTGTALGDPIEVTALTEAFRASTQARGFCALGSLKTNVGHLNAAAGVAGLIKAALAVEHGEIPPSLHYTAPNPALDLANSPFYVSTALHPWPAQRGPGHDGAPPQTPRRAGVSSFGIGGTNAHVVIEQGPPAPRPEAARRPAQILTLSARSDGALSASATNLAAHLERHPDADLADAAFTLQVGRRAFLHRRAVVCRDTREAVARLGTAAPGRVASAAPEIAFLFPGQGAQHPGMAEGVYRTEPVFRAELDRCAELLRPHLGLDLRDAIHPAADRAPLDLRRTDLAQPALFAVSYALAVLWASWGIRPATMLGHSVGEYVAACLAGVFALEDALALVAARGRLMQALPAGAMLAVSLPERDLAPLLGGPLALAAVNGPSSCVASGPVDAVDRLEQRLRAEGVACRRLATSHAFHSPMVEPVLEPFAELVRRARPQPPALPYLSNVTGAPVTAAQATDPWYWARHARETVRFSAAVLHLSRARDRVCLEVGPGRTLSSLAARQEGSPSSIVALASLGPPGDERAPEEHLLGALGELWAAGARVDWEAFHAGHHRRRIDLPTYPFERRRHWVDPPTEEGVRPEPPVNGTAAGHDSRAPATPAEPLRAPSGAHPRPDLATPYVAPRSAVEREIAAICADILGIDRVGLHDSLFDLGADSMTALRVTDRIRQALGHALPPGAAFQAWTVEHLAQSIAGGLAGGAASPLVPVRIGGTRPPLFFVHPAAGVVFPYFELARQLGPDQPFYALQAVGLAGECAPDTSVEQMADRYLAVVRAARPRGPYLLGGFSFGCLVAFEMAQRLRRAGQSVGLVALVDTPAPVAGHRPSSAALGLGLAAGIARSIWPHLHDYFYLAHASADARGEGASHDGGDPQTPGPAGPRAPRDLVESFLARSAMARFVPRESLLVALRQPAMLPMFRLFVLHLRAATAYAPAGYPGRVTLFRTGGPRAGEPGMGWELVARGGVEVHDVPGEHLTVLRRPHVEVLGARLRESITAALRPPAKVDRTPEVCP